MADAKPFVVAQDVASSENAEFFRAQMQFLQNRTLVLRQLLVNTEAERDELKSELAKLRAETGDKPQPETGDKPQPETVN